MPRDGLMMNNLQWVSEICEKIILKIMQWLLDFVDLTMYRIIFIPNNFCWIYFINEDKSNYTNVTLNPSLVVGVVIISVLGGNVGTSFFNMYLCLLDSTVTFAVHSLTPSLFTLRQLLATICLKMLSQGSQIIPYCEANQTWNLLIIF